MRGELNLSEHAGLLHRRLSVRGVLSAYFGGAGMRQVDGWQLLPKDGAGDADGGGDDREVAPLRVEAAEALVEGGRVVKAGR